MRKKHEEIYEKHLILKRNMCIIGKGDIFMRIIGLDYGDSRIGVAVSDAMGLTAQPVGALSEKTWARQFEKLGEIVAEYKAEAFVIGMPLNMNGTMGPRGEVTRKFEEALREKFGLPVTEWDERLSSVSAHRALTEGGVHGTKKKGKVDMLAAVFILQGYLDSLQKQKGE